MLLSSMYRTYTLWTARTFTRCCKVYALVRLYKDWRHPVMSPQVVTFRNVVPPVYSHLLTHSGSLKSGIYLYSNYRLDAIYLIIRNRDKRCVTVLKKKHSNKKFTYCVHFQSKNITLSNAPSFGHILTVAPSGIKAVMSS